MFIFDTEELRLLVGGNQTSFVPASSSDRDPDPPVDDDEIPPSGP